MKFNIFFIILTKSLLKNYNQKMYHFNYLRWQCRRGMLELDQILTNFLNFYYKSLSRQEKLTFKILLEQNDADLFNWFNGKGAPEDPNLNQLTKLIKDQI